MVFRIGFLFDVFVDGVLYDWSDVVWNVPCDCSSGNFTYVWFHFDVVGLGFHNVTVVQSDCVVVVDSASLWFNVSFVGDGFVGSWGRLE